MWVRGLKLKYAVLVNPPALVAPRVGAWIETFLNYNAKIRSLVAPRVGAWIETFLNYNAKIRSLVAPRVGAWIET